MTIVKRQTYDISGMGGGYEGLCQTMLWRGVTHLAIAKPPVEMWTQALEHPQIEGVMLTDGEELTALEHAIIKPGDGATGAMHQYVMRHLRFIHTSGLEAWREELAPHRPEGAYEWEGEI